MLNTDFNLNLLPKPQMRKHSNFFSSLKQVEKRLKSEDPPPPRPAPPQQQQQPPQDSNDTCTTDSLSSPIYLHSYRPNQSSTLPENSEAAPAFLSSSPPFPSTPHEDPPPEIKNPEQRDEFEANPDEDSIRRLIELLGLSDLQEEEDGKGGERDGEGLVSDYDCESGFYSKIVGVKGPKCGKEVERLEGWIKHLKNGGDEIIEPLRLAHLLLGKAALVSEEEGAGCGYGGLDFPATIDEFLHNDSPAH